MGLDAPLWEALPPARPPPCRSGAEAVFYGCCHETWAHLINCSSAIKGLCWEKNTYMNICKATFEFHFSTFCTPGGGLGQRSVLHSACTCLTSTKEEIGASE